MIKLILITVFIFFIAELIIAISIITRICKFDKCVNDLNNSILANKKNIQKLFADLYLLFNNLANYIFKIKNIVLERRNYYFISFLKTALAYYGIFVLRGKYKKAMITYQLAKEIYEGFSET